MNSRDAHKKFLKELKSGTVALLLLGILDRAREPMYGYQITKEIDADLLDIKQSALYPVLRSLERSGLLASDIEPSASGPPRRYYRITGSGKEALSSWQDAWEDTKSLVDSVLKGRTDADAYR